MGISSRHDLKSQQKHKPEEKYFSFQNDIIQALYKIKIPGEARQVLDFIIMETWGWKWKFVQHNLCEICRETGLDKYSAIRGIQRLSGMKILKVEKSVKKSNIFSVNENVSEWTTNWKNENDKVTKMSPSQGDKKVTKLVTKMSPEGDKNVTSLYNNKNNIKNISKNTENERDFFKSFLKAAGNLWRGISENNSHIPEPDISQWAATLSTVGAEPDDLEWAAIWCQDDLFWRPKILSASDLVKHYARIKALMNVEIDKMTADDKAGAPLKPVNLYKEFDDVVNVNVALSCLRDCRDITQLVALWIKEYSRWKSYLELKSFYQEKLRDFAFRLIDDANDISDLDIFFEDGVMQETAMEEDIRIRLDKRYEAFTGHCICEPEMEDAECVPS